ncbi:unnamed protein product [Lactuca saligna]|uniref:Uncharacterized protein n=1 Tax=Lactuca saligna TaxID=75948 RepID=A0AA36EJP6_LACSI|nr:unnamed protein product [Lactuca saligna]
MAAICDWMWPGKSPPFPLSTGSFICPIGLMEGKCTAHVLHLYQPHKCRPRAYCLPSPFHTSAITSSPSSFSAHRCKFSFPLRLFLTIFLFLYEQSEMRNWNSGGYSVRMMVAEYGTMSEIVVQGDNQQVE